MKKKTIKKTICMTKEEAEIVERGAVKHGKSISQYLVDTPDKLYKILPILSYSRYMLIQDNTVLTCEKNDIPASYLESEVMMIQPLKFKDGVLGLNICFYSKE